MLKGEKKPRTQYTYHAGIDEAGRGPLAGPVAVGGVVVPATMRLKAVFPRLDDSKRMTEAAREKVYEAALARQERGDIRFVVTYSSAADIDHMGITVAVRRAVEACIAGLGIEKSETTIFLDGLLAAPHEYTQQTIIHGDALIPAISLASVVAKVSRDRLMVEYAVEHPGYGLEHHKGYGTAAHCAAIKKLGLSPLHRKSFIHVE